MMNKTDFAFLISFLRKLLWWTNSSLKLITSVDSYKDLESSF